MPTPHLQQRAIFNFLRRYRTPTRRRSDRNHLSFFICHFFGTQRSAHCGAIDSGRWWQMENGKWQM